MDFELTGENRPPRSVALFDYQFANHAIVREIKRPTGTGLTTDSDDRLPPTDSNGAYTSAPKAGGALRLKLRIKNDLRP